MPREVLHWRMGVGTTSNDEFDLAIGQCQGDFSVALFNTLFSIGVDSMFLLLSIPSLFFLLRSPTIHRTPAALLASNLVRTHCLMLYDDPLSFPLMQYMAARLTLTLYRSWA
jgi:hypothetical protein